ncbi:flagellar protein FliT [Paenalcaligenes hominis]|uniref:flagellar protein FliT n=1 Tax=Paenalcaligenes hominis TaxID=643674 RepID=UPI00352429EC
MPSSPSVTLQQYQVIADLSHRMLDEARRQQWGQVIALSQEYIQAVEHLKALTELNQAERHARRDLLTKILEDDAEIRLLAEPELRRLGHILGDMKRQQSVVNAYCSPTYSA